MTAQQEAVLNKEHQHDTHIFDKWNGEPTLINESHRGTGIRPKDNSAANIFGADTTNQQAKNKGRRGYNPITGAPYEEEEPVKQAPVVQAPVEQPAAAGIHTSSRVLQPPGGKTTRLW